MRKLLLVVISVLVGSAAGLFSPPPVKAEVTCITYCTTPNGCGYVCCYERCYDGRCIDLDYAPPPPCD